MIENVRQSRLLLHGNNSSWRSFIHVDTDCLHTLSVILREGGHRDCVLRVGSALTITRVGIGLPDATIGIITALIHSLRIIVYCLIRTISNATTSPGKFSPPPPSTSAPIMLSRKDNINELQIIATGVVVYPLPC